MAVYYKFKSAKDFGSLPIDGDVISVWDLKFKIFESKRMGSGTDFDLLISNAETNEDYTDEEMLIPKNTSVLVHRIPGLPRMPIVVERDKPKATENNKAEEIQEPDPSIAIFPEESEWNEFVNDLRSISEVLPVQLGSPAQETLLPNRDDEDRKIKELVNTPALGWQWQSQDAFGPRRCFGKSVGDRMIRGHGFGRSHILERKTPPQGYICHRCKMPGHFIQHCPTNGDPNFDIKRLKHPMGIPKSMLMATPDGSYALPSGSAAVLKPNEAAFLKEIEGLPSTRSPVADLPPELHCPLCKKLMKDAALSSKCCFKSFCDNCIREHIISKKMCVCGATNILADDLVPNMTLRKTINRIMESTTGSAEITGSSAHSQDMESADHSQLKVPSQTLPTLVKQHTPLLCKDDNCATQETVKEEKADVNSSQQSLETSRATKSMDRSGAMLESSCIKETTSHGSAPQAEEEAQQKMPSEQAKKKKKKTNLPANAVNLQWETPQDFAAENFAMPFDPLAYNPCMGGMVWGMDAYITPYAGLFQPYMGYTPGVFEAPFAGILPQYPFGGQWCNMPPLVSQRECSKVSCGADTLSLKSKSSGIHMQRRHECTESNSHPRPREPAKRSSDVDGTKTERLKHKPSYPDSSDGMKRRKILDGPNRTMIPMGRVI